MVDKPKVDLERSPSAKSGGLDSGGSPAHVVYLTETFYISSKKNTVFEVRLTDKGLSLKKQSNGSTKEQTIPLKDIIGCRCLRSKRKTKGSSACACTSISGTAQLKVVEENSGEQDESDVSAYLYIYAYILKRNRRGGFRERTTITLRFRSFDKYEDNNKEAQKWRAAVKYLVAGESIVRPVYHAKDSRKMLVILNPKSGSGKAREMFQQRVAPVLAEAEISYDLHITKKPNWAREFVRNRDIYLWRGIVVVGGDGIFYEALNGLFEREDWQTAVDELAIGIIPCGSGNGLAKTIAYLYDEPFETKPILASALTVVKGKHSMLDIVRVETRSHQIREVVREIDQAAKEATIALQVIHSSLTDVGAACLSARQQFEVCRKGYQRLAELIPEGQYYRYNDHWHFLTQRVVFLVALTVYLEKGFLVSRDTTAEVLGMKTKQSEGFHLDIEDYLMGVLQMASELSRYAINSVTLGDYERPLSISKFVADLNSGYRLLNLKNDGLRKRFDALKYDVKKIEEIVYDISIRGLRADAGAGQAAAASAPAAASGAEQ